MKKVRSLLVALSLWIVLSPISAQITAKKEGYFRIAVLGCHRQFEPAPALSRYLEAEPDLCLWIGDNVYADAPDDPAFIQTCYDALGAKPAFKELMEAHDYMVTWDDHDFGLNDAGKEYPFKRESKEMFRKFWQLEDVIPAEQEGIFYARNFDLAGHTLQVVMLDCRYNRDAPDGFGDVLGETQWKWLKEQLQQPADLRLLVSGFQILLDKDAGSETWDKFPKAKTRLFELIRKTQAENVIFLTGDQHYGEVCRLRNAMDYDAIELQFAGINQIEDPEFNPLRVARAIQSKHSIAVIDIQMDSTKEEVPHLVFQIADAMENKTELLYRVNLDEIALQLDFTRQQYFAEEQEIMLRHFYPDLEVRYTVNGTEPTAKSKLYAAPFTIQESTVVKARFFTKDQQARSHVFTHIYEKLKPVPAIKPKEQIDKGLTYRYYEGQFEQLPDFQTLQPQKKGIALNFEVATIAQREDHYAIVFEGLIDIPVAGVYSFFTISDDGSKLYISDRTVVDNDGSHSRRKRSGIIALEKGLHPIQIAYFEDYSGQVLRVGYTGPSGEQVALPGNRLFHFTNQ